MIPLSQNSKLTAGFLFALASAALFAIRPIFVKLVYVESVTPLSLIMLRMLFSMPVYIAILLFLLRKQEHRAQLTPKVIFQISLAGLLGYYSASFLDLIGLQYVTAQLGRMLLYSYPTFVVILGALFLGRSIERRTVISLIITYVGVALIFGHELQELGPDVLLGGFFITAAAITFAIYLLLGKPLIDKIGSQLFTCVALLAASIGIFMHYAIGSSFSVPQPSNIAIGLIIAIAIFCTVIPTFFTAEAIALIGPDKTGIVAMIGPAFTSIFAVIVLAESFTLFHAIGISLSVLGIFILHKPKTIN